ncbi:trypsin-like serine peptidase [Aliiruegeria sabulilitoris]|uniref:trypsin-like serine peptidase n=1 Tax=Aliiruegeria sabulilitoris TaxID=1510458 RepID=UPI00082A152A|nr:trypsin-like serine protease [Aliiruegeria sabulilitoris]NDR58209.1 trypsin-like serine protease [Pseudoruegeria sp. M32A2M]
MLRPLIFFLACLLAATAARSEGETRLEELSTADDTRGWEAVGRIDMGHGSFCTGALIAPDMVLTAAHCLFEPDTGELIPVAQMEFLAGFRNGRAEAYRGIRRAVSHPEYDFGSDQKVFRVSRDLALLELERPIRSTHVIPFDIAGARLRKGNEVTVVSYAENRAAAPSLQQVCHVLESYRGVGMLSCSVDFGASGAPIFLMSETGPRIVSVVSAKAEAGGQPVALGGQLHGSMEALEEALSSATYVGMGARLSGSPDSNRLGAKFLRP